MNNKRLKSKLAASLLSLFFISTLAHASGATVATPLQKNNTLSAVSCNGIKLMMSMPESEIEMHCKVTKLKSEDQITSGQSAQKVKTDDPLEIPDPSVADLSKIRFIADDQSVHICYYHNNLLIKCKTNS